VVRWTDQAVRDALGLALPPEPASYAAISTDTRQIGADTLFLALKGERFDGHDFLAQAAAGGATGAVVAEGTPEVAGLRLYRVPDTLRALGRLGRARRRHLTGPVVAITGTNGKTSTKEMIAAVLATRYRVHATRKNLNNLIGVPLSILEAPDDTEALVLEAGASVPGEIARAREIIAPSIAVITNVAPGHLEGFGGIDQVLLEKISLAEGVPVAIIGSDPPGLVELARKRARKVISAGLVNADRTPTAVEMTADGRPRVTVAGQTFLLDARGRHQAGNAMLALTVGEVLGVPVEKMARALEALTLPGGRGEIRQVGQLTILDDSYNANPGSFRAAIELARSLRTNRRLVFVAGTMRELGRFSTAHHGEVAGQLAALRPEILAAVGEFGPALEPYRANLGERLLVAADPAELAPLLVERLKGDELVVLKGSRGVALERLIPDLEALASRSD
jgi:UDP-N-acetylmuramoyl-tripeptide--D-alanyl-D-alanine ligase